ncbi:MAG: hypothetical protein ACTSU2_08770 [Promethearchaeota archaeon]
MAENKITPDELEEGKKSLAKLSEEEKKKIEEEKKKRLAELEKVKAALEEAAKKEGKE